MSLFLVGLVVLVAAVLALFVLPRLLGDGQDSEGTGPPGRRPGAEPQEQEVRAGFEAWDSSWKPYQKRRRRRDDDPVTYRAEVRGSDVEGPRWDPYDSTQSRVHRVREARHRARVSTVPDYYALLGLDRRATDEDIARAYKRYAAMFHPDKFHGDAAKSAQAEARLKELNKAMEILRNPTRRAQYDARL